MNSLQLHCCVHFLHPKHRLRCSTIFNSRTCHFPGKISFRESFRIRAKSNSFRCFAQSETKEVSLAEKEERSPFDINLAVILAGFAFEAYASPPGNIGKREVNASGCNTLYLSEYVKLFWLWWFLKFLIFKRPCSKLVNFGVGFSQSNDHVVNFMWTQLSCSL